MVSMYPCLRFWVLNLIHCSMILWRKYQKKRRGFKFYCIFDILQKIIFCYAFNSNWKNWFLIANILSRTIVLSVSVCCFQIFTLKLILQPKMSPTYAISVVNWIVGNIILENIFFSLIWILNYWCSITILWKFQKYWTNGSCRKLASKLSTLMIFA